MEMTERKNENRQYSTHFKMIMPQESVFVKHFFLKRTLDISWVLIQSCNPGKDTGRRCLVQYLIMKEMYNLFTKKNSQNIKATEGCITKSFVKSETYPSLKFKKSNAPHVASMRL